MVVLLNSVKAGRDVRCLALTGVAAVGGKEVLKAYIRAK
jgi:hypothetical protein